MYTIGQVSKMFNIPVSTLRYYDKEGLFPTMQRESGIRQFSDNELEALRVIDCLKKLGLEIKDIKKFMDWNQQGPETYSDRYDLFVKQKAVMEEEIESMKRVLSMIEYKIWYYSQAMADGNEDRVNEMIPDGLPAAVRVQYEHSHS